MKLTTFALCAAGLFCLMALPTSPGARPLPDADGIPEPEEMQGGGLSDWSRRDAPKTVASRDLVRFRCEFHANPAPSVPCRGGSVRIPVRSGEPAGRYAVTLEKTGRGARFSIACRDSRTGRETHHAEGGAPASALADLQGILERNGTAGINGYYRRNTALGEDFSLEARYASGEAIAASGEGGASVLPSRGLPLGEFRRFFLNLAARAGKPLYEEKPLQGDIKFLQYEFLLTDRTALPAFGKLPRGMIRLFLAREGGGMAKAYAGWSDPAESGRRKALVWTTVFESKVPAAWLDRLQACFDKRQLARLNGYRRYDGMGVPGMHFDPAAEAAVRIVGDWANGGTYEVLAYGREDNLPAREYLDDGWMPAFFAQLAKENGLPLTLKQP